MKRWIINRPDEVKGAEFASKCDLSRLAIDVLTSRGINTFDELVDFFNNDELASPEEIKDMQLAAKIISDAIDRYDLICIYGDYDCDGVTSTAVLYTYLDSIGANVMYYIPERADGYGLNEYAVRSLAEQGVKLIVTVDNGIASVEEAKLIKELDMELVVTDHHQAPPELPDARAIVDPHQQDCPSEFKDLCGVGVALKLCAMLDDGNYDIVLDQFADICAIGTIADVVPLNGENRTLVKKGLENLKNTENLGLLHLMELTKFDKDSINSVDISFKISPVINASGRFGSPITAVKLLLAENDDEAASYAETLVTLNNQRKEVERQIMGEIVKHLNDNPDVLNHRVIVVDGKGWHHGVVGIISSKILDYYGKPNFIITTDENGNSRGSARSLKGFNIFKCLQHCSDVLTKLGGHECAGGFSLKEEDIGRFRKMIYEYSESQEKFPVYTLTADKLLQPQELNVSNIDSLSRLEPFGEANSTPTFAILGAVVKRISPMGQEGLHTKIDYTYGSASGVAKFFNLKTASPGFSVGNKLDMLVNLEVNRFNGRESAEAKVVDFRLSGVKQERYFAAKETYEKLMRGETLPANFIKKIIPVRQELVNVYKYISAVKITTLDNLFMRLTSDTMNYCKLRICIDIFAEKGLIKFLPASEKIGWVKPEHKVDLDDAPILKKLNTML